MTEIRAFVGHSFAEVDDPVVRTYLEYFDEVQKMGLGFSWDHARDAEAKNISDKVLMKVRDKNLFIAICNRNEKVITAKELKPSILPWKHLAAPEDSFQWKTSDWITQEIGLAVGQGMELMILLENGVRRPGNLQGNHEYIYFDRNAPEKTFKQILQTISSLMPKASVSTAETIKPDTERGPTEPEDQEERVDLLEPKSNWTRQKFAFAFLHAIANHNAGTAKKIDMAFLASAHAQQPDELESWEAVKERLRLKFGEGGKLSNLENFAKIHKQNSDVHRYLALAYRDYDQHMRAAEYFELAAELTDSDKEKLENYGEAVLALIDSGENVKARSLIQKIKMLACSIKNDGEQLLIDTLRQIAEKQGNNDAVFGLYECILHLVPDDADARFNLAYGYSKAELEDVSLFHYLRVRHPSRDSDVWNNLGVQFDHFGLVSKSVVEYRKAEKSGETLAMSNLAFKFLELGFLQEAEDICNKALALDNCNKRINQVLTRIKEIPEEEANKQEEITSKGLPLSEFFMRFGRAFIQPDYLDHTGLWQGPDCELKITIAKGKFVAMGEYEGKHSGLSLANGLLGTSTYNSTPLIKRFQIKIEGSVEGKSIRGTIRRDETGKEASPPSVLMDGKESTVLIALSDSMRQAYIYEPGKPDTQKFYQLNCIG